VSKQTSLHVFLLHVFLEFLLNIHIASILGFRDE
jgi:hypothetical protein